MADSNVREHIDSSDNFRVTLMSYLLMYNNMIYLHKHQDFVMVCMETIYCKINKVLILIVFVDIRKIYKIIFPF